MTSPPSTDPSLAAAAQAFRHCSKPSSGEWVTNVSFDEARTLVAKAFTGNGNNCSGEASHEWVMQHFVGITQEQKLATVSFFMSLYVKEQMRKNSVLFTKKQDGVFVSTIIVREYEAAVETNWWNKTRGKLLEAATFFGLMMKDGMPPPFKDKKLRETGQKAGTVFGLMEQQWKSAHHKVMPNNHWYVSIVATDPDYQGQGHGSELMKRVTGLADGGGVDCYLECCSEKAQSYYEKFGFITEESCETENLFDKEEGAPCPSYFMVRRHANGQPTASG